MTDLSGKVILVTGASSGIGRASAKIMARRGAKVMLVARDGQALAKVRGDIEEAGGTAAIFPADVGVRDQTYAAIDAAEGAFGPIDGVFANAGMSGAFDLIQDYSDEDFDDILNVNLKSLFWAMKRVLPSMIERRTGSILATGSLASERGFPLAAGYVATKHALLGLVRCGAAEASRHNVRINAILPGMIETRLIENLADQFGGLEATHAALGQMAPMGRMGKSEEIGEVVAFLMSDGASYISGQAISVDGGVLGTFATGQ